MKLRTSSESMENGTETKEEQLERETKEGAFENFKLGEDTITKLRDRKIEYLFPVQTSTFEPIYSGKDAIVRARTGTGKTMAFALPVIEKLKKKPNRLTKSGRSPQVLVLAPTRELAKQIGNDFSSVSSLKSVCVYGGVPFDFQKHDIAAGCDVIAGTPGRVLDFLERAEKTLSLKKVKFMILDEVDRMLDMGFSESVEKIMAFAYEKEKKPQTLLFSATMPAWVHTTAGKYMRADKKFSIDLVGLQANKTSTTVQHLAIKCTYHRRAAVVGDVLSVYSGRHGRAMVFCEKKRDADDLAVSPEIKQDTHVMHGDIPQNKRELVLKGFREGKYQVLITTDVAARGLDIPEVDLVIQTCPPTDVDSYIHRSGRTGRAGRTGTCLCFYKPAEEYALKQVERIAGIKFKRVGGPTSEDIIKAAAEDSTRSLENITPETLEHFRLSAERLVEERGAVEALAAALAVISGSTEIKDRSLVTAQEGMSTFLFKTNTAMQGFGYVWNSLERRLGAEVKEKVVNMRMCKDKQGAVFDVPSELCSYVDDHWSDGRYDTLEKATELPELFEYEVTRPVSTGRGGFRGGRGGRGGFRGSFGGAGGRGGFNSGGAGRGSDSNGFRGRGQKRTFNGSSNGAPSHKKFME